MKFCPIEILQSFPFYLDLLVPADKLLYEDNTNTALGIYSNIKLNLFLNERNPTGLAKKISATQ